MKIIDKYIFPVFIFISGITLYIPHNYRMLITITGAILLPIISIKRNHKFLLDRNFNVFIILFLYVTWAFISTLLNIYKSGSLAGFIRLFMFMVIILSYYLWCDNNEKIILTLKAIFLIGIILALSICYEFFSNNLRFINTQTKSIIRYCGIYNSVNGAALVISYSIVSYFLLIKYKCTSKFYSLSIPIIILAFSLTGSRSAWLLIIITFSLYYIRAKLRSTIFIFSIFSLCILTFLIFSNPEIIRKSFRLETGLAGRENIWHISYDITKKHPIFGVGIDGLASESEKYYKGIDKRSWEWGNIKNTLNNPHNMFLASSTELGFIGAILLLLLIIQVLISFYNNKRNKFEFEYQKDIYKFTLSLFFALLLRGFFEANGILFGGSLGYDLYFWLFYIMLNNQVRFINQKRKEHD